MTGQEKRERETFYTTVILALKETPEVTGSLFNSRDQLLEILPLYADAGSLIEMMVRAMLLGADPEGPLYENTEENREFLELWKADKETARETETLYNALKNAETSSEIDEAMREFGWHCLQILEAIPDEGLL